MSTPRTGNAQLDNVGRLTIGNTQEAQQVVTGLNADKVDGLDGSEILLTNVNRTIASGTVITNNGTIIVPSPGLINVTSGRIVVGEFILESTPNGGVSIGFR